MLGSQALLFCICILDMMQSRSACAGQGANIELNWQALLTLIAAVNVGSNNTCYVYCQASLSIGQSHSQSAGYSSLQCTGRLPQQQQQQQEKRHKMSKVALTAATAVVLLAWLRIASSSGNCASALAAHADALPSNDLTCLGGSPKV
jgi:hypothetical protein